MTFSIRQSVLGTDGTSTLVASVTQTITAVNADGKSTVMGYVGYGSSTTALQALTVKDSANNVYTIPQNSFNTNAADTTGLIAFYFINVPGSPTSITVTAEGVKTIKFVRFVLKEVSGIGSFDNSTIQQQGAGNVGGPANSANAMTSGVTPTLGTTNDFVYGGGIVTGDTLGGTMAAGTNFTINSNGFSGNVLIGDEDFFPYTLTTGIAATFTPATWTGLDTITAVMAFSPFSACAGSLAMRGVGCSVGWRASLLAGAAWRASKAIERNGIISRRRLILPSGRC